MRLADFALERYFAEWEFSVRPILCASDVQGYPMADLLALADDEQRFSRLILAIVQSDPFLRRRAKGGEK